MKTEYRAEQKRAIIAMLEGAIELAKAHDFVIEVQCIPKAPLAMGNYDMVTNVRDKQVYVS